MRETCANWRALAIIAGSLCVLPGAGCDDPTAQDPSATGSSDWRRRHGQNDGGALVDAGSGGGGDSGAAADGGTADGGTAAADAGAAADADAPLLSCSDANVLCVGTGRAYADIQSAVNAASAGSTVLVDPGSYSGTIHVTKSGAAGSPIVVKSSTKSGAVLKGGFDVSGSYVTIDGFDITNTGNPGVDGIYATGDNQVFLNNSLHECGGFGINFDGAGVTVKNNTVYHSTFGIQASGTGYLVEGNTIERLYHYWSDDDDYMRFWGTDGTFRGNVMRGTLIGTAETGGDPSQGGSHVDCFQTWTLPGDTGATRRIVFEGNYCTDSYEGVIARDLSGEGIGAHESDLTIVNNVFVDNGNSVLVFQGVANVRTYNNVIAVLKRKPIYLVWYQGPQSGGSGTTGDVRNNIIYDATNSIPAWAFQAESGSSFTHSNNLFFGFTPNSGMYDSSDVLGKDPAFVDAANQDFHLRAGSPAIDAGYALPGVVTDDRDGRARPQGAAWDIGAYEF